jgi:nucleoside-diphosphate-sugar epimerase
VARALAVVMESAWKVLRLRGRPLLTRYIVDATTVDFSFVHHAATRDLGYAPVVDPDTAHARTLEWLRKTL